MTKALGVGSDPRIETIVKEKLEKIYTPSTLKDLAFYHFVKLSQHLESLNFLN